MTARSCASTSSAATRSCSRWSSQMTDDDIWSLQPRRPRSAQDLRRVRSAQTATRASRPSAGQDHQGLRHGQARRRQEHRAPDQEADRRDVREFRDRFNMPIPTTSSRSPVLQAVRRHARDASTCTNAARHWAATCRTRRDEGRRAAARCRTCRPSRRCSSPRPKAARSRPRRRYVRFLTQLLRDKALGPAHGADPGRRSAHLRHGRPVPADRHLQPRMARSTRRSTRTR